MEPLFTVESTADLASETPLVVDSKVTQRLYVEAAKAADSPPNILIRGEPGVGKKTLARWIHQKSHRARGPLVTLPCAAGETAVEIAMFGYARGAFVDTAEGRAGAFESARGGTLVLDAVGALSRTAQVMCLRVIEDRATARIAALERVPVDARIVSTSSANLEGACRVGVFRPDLLFRLSSFTLTMPPLRERHDEIEPLSRRFLIETARDDHVPALSSAVLDLFRSFVWPRNVAQLREVVATAYGRCSGAEITPAHVDVEALRLEVPIVPNNYDVPDYPDAPSDLTPPEKYERARIIAALSDTKGNATRMAMRLGIPRRSLIAKLERYRIPRPRSPEKTE